MEEVLKGDVLDNFNFWSRANIISDITKKVTISDIAKKTKDSKSNIYFHNLLKFLEKEDFLDVDRTTIPHLYKIKGNKLSWFLIQGEIGKHFKINTEVRMGIKPHYIGY